MSDTDGTKAMELLGALQDEGIDCSDLDSTVHDIATKMATDINNGGMLSQAEFLAEHGWKASNLA